VSISNAKLNTYNVVNNFMDHSCGFYTSLKRLSRFAAIIQAGATLVQEINYKGTPPLRQKFVLRSNKASTIIRVRYPKAGSFIIKDANGKEVAANGWDKARGEPFEIRGANGGYCGENRYVGVINILEFYITKNCTIYI
jgi:hypothetical protein